MQEAFGPALFAGSSGLDHLIALATVTFITFIIFITDIDINLAKFDGKVMDDGQLDENRREFITPVPVPPLAGL